MILKKYLKLFDSSYVKEKVFRREIESAFSSGKKFPMPAVKNVTKNSLDEFKNNFPFLYFDKDSTQEYALLLSQIENSALTITSADELVKNVCTFFNNEKIFLGEDINWNKEYKSNFSWPDKLSWKIDYMDFPKGVDPENAWQLGRLAQLFPLAKAFFLTNNELYLEKYLSIIDNFGNPLNYCKGIQWVKSSEVSIRLINCLLSFGLIIHSKLIDETIINSFIRFVLLHAVFIENNPQEKYSKGCGHLLNLLSLGMMGLLFNDTQYGKRNTNYAVAGLEQEIRTQVYQDGVTIHQSVPYHQLVTKVFYIANQYLTKKGEKFSNEYRSILHKLFLVQKEYLRSNGTIPAIGDDLNFNLAPFNQSQSNQEILLIGTLIFRDKHLKLFDQKITAECLFLFGKKSLEEYSSISVIEAASNSVGFSSGGHFIMRSTDVEIFIEAGEIGNKGKGAPGHNDTFTFELYYKNKPIIVDPGTYSFYSDLILRNQLRSVKRHNTFYVDNQLLAEFEGSFNIKVDYTKPKVLDWQTSEFEDVLSAQHHAYARLSDPVIIKRSLNFQKNKKVIRIKDEFYGGAEHQISGNLIFYPGIMIEQLNETNFAIYNQESELKINFKSSAEKTALKILPAEYSKSYGALTTTKRIFINAIDRLPCYIITEIFLL